MKLINLISIFTIAAAFNVSAHESSCETELYKSTQGKIDEVVRRISNEEFENAKEGYFQRYCNAGGDHTDGHHKCSAKIGLNKKTVFLDTDAKVELSDVRFGSITCKNAFNFPKKVTAPLRKCRVYYAGSGSSWTPFGTIHGSASRTEDGLCMGNIVINDARSIEKRTGETFTLKYNQVQKLKCQAVFDTPTDEYPAPISAPIRDPKLGECGLFSIDDTVTFPGYVIHDSNGNIVLESVYTRFNLNKKIDVQNYYFSNEDDV